MSVTLTIKCEFDEGELKKELAKTVDEAVLPALETAMTAVGEGGKELLLDHVGSDVYAKWHPTTYHRTYALQDMSSIIVNPSSLRLFISYEPSGASDQWENPANNNALIGRIESGSGYEWRKHPGPRPFWQNFVNEMIDSYIGPTFDASMAATLGDMYEGNSEVSRDGDDGAY